MNMHLANIVTVALKRIFPLRCALLRMDTMVERWFEKVPQSARPSSLCRFMRQCY